MLLHKIWKRRWKNSLRFPLINFIDVSLPSNNFLKLINSLDQHQSALIITDWALPAEPTPLLYPLLWNPLLSPLQWYHSGIHQALPHSMPALPAWKTPPQKKTMMPSRLNLLPPFQPGSHQILRLSLRYFHNVNTVVSNVWSLSRVSGAFHGILRLDL